MTENNRQPEDDDTTNAKKRDSSDYLFGYGLSEKGKARALQQIKDYMSPLRHSRMHGRVVNDALQRKLQKIRGCWCHGNTDLHKMQLDPRYKTCNFDKMEEEE